MSKIISTFFAIVVLFVVAAAATLASAQSQSIDYQSCSTAVCQPGTCQSQSFSSGQCLQVNGRQAHSVQISVNPKPQMCSQAWLYSDSKCTNRTATLDSVCNSCQNGFSIACGALFMGTFVVNECNSTSGVQDPTCSTCLGPTIVGYDACHLLPGTNPTYVMVKRPVSCPTTVVFNLFTNSTSCQGTPIPAFYWDTHCNEGQIFTVTNSSNSGSGSSSSGGEKFIDLDFGKLQF